MRQSASLPWIGRRRTRVRYSSSVSFSGMSSSQLPEASAGTESSDCNSNSASMDSMLGLAGLSGSAARFAASAAAMASARALALAASDAAFAACTFSLASSAAALAASSRLAWSSGGSGTGGGCATSPSGILLPGSPAAKFTTRHARRFDVRIAGRLTGAHIVEARMVAIGIGGKSALIRVSRRRALFVTNRCQRGKRVDVGLQMSNYLVVTSNTPFPILARIREKISRSVSRVIDRLTAAHEIDEIGGLGIAPRRHSISCGLSRLWPLRTAGATPAA